MLRQLYVLTVSLFLAFSTLAQTVTGFDQGHHTGGNTISTNVDFPTDLSNISQILMHVSLDCPAGGCDPWDRFASLKVDLPGYEIEIGRYVTPYGNDWCDWTIDVTEYRELLTGNQTLQSHIETWSNGWLINTEFEFISGTPDYQYATVQNLWSDYDLTYGDTLFYSIDLPEQIVNIPANAEQVVLRIVNTGHGQGNTDNAAEFSQKTHEIMVNGNTEFTQFLWKDDCESNPCSPQGGTWQHDRAGWCPGQDVTPDDYDITALVTPGQTATLDYVLEPFLNECSPWHLDCEDGVTCAQCQYNSDTHTRPHYKVVGQLIVKSSTPLPASIQQVDPQLEFILFPNPSESGALLNFQVSTNEEFDLLISDLTGKLLYSGLAGGRNNQIQLNDLEAGVYLITAQNDSFNISKKLIIQ